MNLSEKFKETVISVAPVMAIVIVLGLTAAPLGFDVLLRFIIGGILLIVGLTVFLQGVDVGIRPLGERCGAALTKKRNLLLLLSVSFIIGFLVTAAEPDIQVFADQVRSMYPKVNKQLLVFMIAGGVGTFMVLGLLRTILRVPLTVILWISYIAIFILAAAGSQGFVGIAFDSGGATTGPMTVPFIMAIGIGVANVRRSSGRESGSDSFGLTGVASIGPVLAVLLYGTMLSDHTPAGAAGAVQNQLGTGMGVFLAILPSIIYEALFSLVPLFILFLVFQFTLLRLPFYQFLRISIGLVYSFVGLVIFLTGVNGGFMSAGRLLGEILGAKASASAGWFVLLVCTGIFIGAVVVLAEPAVWVLTEQVEEVSGGTIKRRVMLVFLSAGAAVAIGLSVFRSIAGFNIMYILIPGYALALLLSLCSSRLFAGIAFDSGGVASGPISSTFVLSFTLGAASTSSGNADAFGVIALIAMTPLIAIQVLGLVFSRGRKSV